MKIFALLGLDIILQSLLTFLFPHLSFADSLVLYAFKSFFEIKSVLTLVLLRVILPIFRWIKEVGKIGFEKKFKRIECGKDKLFSNLSWKHTYLPWDIVQLSSHVIVTWYNNRNIFHILKYFTVAQNIGLVACSLVTVKLV